MQWLQNQICKLVVENECHTFQMSLNLLSHSERWYCRAKEEVEVKACSASMQSDTE